ncbi:LINE-1 retrotransposable element ORF1 protein, partial [Plecturocebus cupreus]
MRNNLSFNRKDVYSEIPPKHQLQRSKTDKSTKMKRNLHKKDEIVKVQNASPPLRDYNDSPAREQNRSENDLDELTEAGFRRWVITNFSELKEHVLTQYKETKNLEKK